jgi:hypothetical protein
MFVRSFDVRVYFILPPLGSLCNNFCCVYYSRANGNLKRKKEKLFLEKTKLFLLKVEARGLNAAGASVQTRTILPETSLSSFFFFLSSS